MPDNKEQQTWDQRWQKKSFSDGWQVDSWLAAHRHILRQGTALDLACGRGRNALFLAEHGYQVTAVDYSRVALNQLQEEGARRGLKLTTRLIDLEQQPDLPAQQFDLVINFYYMHRPLLPSMQKLVKPGGLIIIRTFSHAGDFEPCRLAPAMVMETGALRQLFNGWEILVYEEGVEASKKGGSLVGIIARKPLNLKLEANQ